MSSQSGQVIEQSYCFLLEFFDGEGRKRREERQFAVHFQRAVCATCFEGVRKGILDTYDPPFGLARIEPLFGDGMNPTVASQGFRVTVPTADGGEFSCDFANSYFHCCASRVRAELRRTGELQEDEKLHYRLTALLDDHVSAASQAPPFLLGETTVQVPITAATRAQFGASDQWDSPDAGDFTVLIERFTIEDIVAESCDTPDREIGGFLLGQLIRDEQRHELFLVVTGCVSGAGTVESLATSVTLTPETFALARRMITLRGRDEQIVGWYHSHPFRLCSACTDELASACIDSKILFYSVDDVQLMEQTFAQPFHVGLLSAVEPRVSAHLGHLPLRLFGWRRGELTARGFEVID